MSLVIGIGIVLYLVSPDTRGSARGVVARMARFIPLQSLKIIIVAWQIVTQVKLQTRIQLFDAVTHS